MNKELMKRNLGQALSCLLETGKLLEESMKWDDIINDILYYERSFGRSLNEEEKKLLKEGGRESLFDKLGLDEEDFNTMLRAFALISAGFTESSDKYDYELEQNNYKALDLFKSLVNDLECVEAERRKTRIGKKEDLGTKIKVEGEDAGYKEENDLDLDEIFENSCKTDDSCEQSDSIKDSRTTYDENKDPELKKVFASATKCKEMGITGDTYEEDDAAWREGCPEDKIAVPSEEEMKINTAIARLDKGCELELDDKTIDAIVEKLWNERDNVSIKIHNNKISLR